GPHRSGAGSGSRQRPTSAGRRAAHRDFSQTGGSWASIRGRRGCPGAARGGTSPAHFLGAAPGPAARRGGFPRCPGRGPRCRSAGSGNPRLVEAPDRTPSLTGTNSTRRRNYASPGRAVGLRPGSRRLVRLLLFLDLLVVQPEAAGPVIRQGRGVV